MPKRYSSLPGFGLTMGFTVFYLGLLVLLPIAAMIFRVFGMTWADFCRYATTPRAMAAYQLTFGASFVAAAMNAVVGTILAWGLVRYEFPLKRFIDSLIDIPFALPTAAAGLTPGNLFA